jgi:hypothetical protein
MSCQISERSIDRAEKKAKAIDLLGGECVNCGSTERLEFDHINKDRLTNYRCITAFVDAKWERVLVELKKCQLLCKSCHCKKSAAERGRGNLRHGESSRWRMGCRCETCTDGNKSRMKEYHRRRKLVVA